MDISQMKNIVVLKDIPSNIVDEAIVILKNNTVIKKREMIENKSINKSDYDKNLNGEFIIQEAENVINDYVRKMERPKESKNSINKLVVKYKKLQIYSFLLGLVAFIGILVSIIK